MLYRTTHLYIDLMLPEVGGLHLRDVPAQDGGVGLGPGHLPESRQIVEDCEDDNRCHVDLDWPVAAKLIKIECSILHPHH